MLEENEAPKSTKFVFPNLWDVVGEVDRVAQKFAPHEADTFKSLFFETASISGLVPLSEEMWGQLENTDSLDVALGDWERVKYHAEGDKLHPRDWVDLRNKIEHGKPLDAPVVMKIGDTLHLVAGNTRLMSARAAGIVPQVLLVEM